MAAFVYRATWFEKVTLDQDELFLVDWTRAGGLEKPLSYLRQRNVGTEVDDSSPIIHVFNRLLVEVRVSCVLVSCEQRV